MTYTCGRPGRVETNAMRCPSGLNVGDKLSEKRPTVKRRKQQLVLMLIEYRSVPSSVARLNTIVCWSGEKAGVKSSAVPVVETAVRLSVPISCRYSQPFPAWNSMYAKCRPSAAHAGDIACRFVDDTSFWSAPSWSI